MDRNTRKGTWGDRVRGIVFACTAVLAMAAGFTNKAQAQVQPGCTVQGVCVSAGPRLATVNTAQGALLNPLLQALLPGTSVNVDVLDWQKIAGADINLNALLIELGADATLSNASQVLASDITLGQLQLAMANVLAADGNTLAANALQLLPLNIGALTGTIKLGDLLQVDLPQGSLADINLDVLDLVMGGVQLYNYENVLTTANNPVTVDTTALGLPGVANVRLWLQVVEPPVYECGPQGTGFHTAAIRIKLNTDLLQGLDTQALQNVVDALNINIPLVGSLDLNDSVVTASVLKLQLYGDIARAEGTIGAIDLLTAAVTLQARPGVVNLYVGTIDDSIFFNRNLPVSEAIVSPVSLSQLNITVRLRFDPILLPALDIADVELPIDVQIRAVAEGSEYAYQSLTFNPAYPQTQVLTCGSQCVGFFASTLLTSLDITMVSGTPVVTLLNGTLSLPLPIQDVVNLITGALETTLDAVVPPIVSPVLNTLLGLVDDLLGLIGIGIGHGYFSVEGLAQSCAAVLSLVKTVQPDTDPGFFNLSISQNATVLASATDIQNNGTTGTVISTPGLSYDFAETAGTNTSLAPYISTWACTNQAGITVGSGTGGTFALTAPALAGTPQSITCRITNRTRQANLSITKSDGVATYTPGGTASYVITVSSAGPDAVTGAVVNDTLPLGATLSAPWSCVATNGTCPASGGTAGDSSISLSIDLDAGGQAQITVPVVFSNNPTDYN